MWLSMLLACSNDDPAPNSEEEDTTTVSSGVYSITLISDTTATSGSEAQPVYFSLENNQVISESLVQTNEWDICFEGIYSSSITVNNGSSATSPGYGGPGKGGIYLLMYDTIEQRYYDAPEEPLTTVPERSWFDEAFGLTTEVSISDDDFITTSINLDHFSGSGDGWAYYDFYGHLFPDSPADEKAHVCYALPRPMLVRTAKGNYAKIIIYSIYEDAPENPDRSYSPGFITLKFGIQKDGSTNLNFTE